VEKADKRELKVVFDSLSAEKSGLDGIKRLLLLSIP
jgi:hypothetical protein